MSGHYSACQFDHAFEPKKLRNWEYGTNPWPGKFAMCSPTRSPCCPTTFIAGNNGHLLPCIARGPSSPWGDYGLHTWEQTTPADSACCCTKAVRLPHLFKPKKDIYITREVPCPNQFARETACEFNCPATQKGMAEDVACGRDPCCPGQKCAMAGCCPCPSPCCSTPSCCPAPCCPAPCCSTPCCRTPVYHPGTCPQLISWTLTSRRGSCCRPIRSSCCGCPPRCNTCLPKRNFYNPNNWNRCTKVVESCTKCRNPRFVPTLF